MNAEDRFSLKGKKALVTGGSRGIGRGIAIALAEHGADVAIVYRSTKDKADQVVEQINKLGRQAWSYQQDLADTEALHDLADRIWHDTGSLDILVNNAGVGAGQRFNQVDLAAWRRVLAVNLDAVFFLTQRVAEHMIAHKIKGRVINISSTNGFVAEAATAQYNASKGALELLTQTLAIELGEHGITVNTIAPGLIETWTAGALDADWGDFAKYYREHIPLEGRHGSVEDCVGAAIFLASRAGAHMTGQHMIIDGGLLCEQVPRIQFMPAYKNTIKK